MSDFETPLMRDVSKMVNRIAIGALCGILIPIIFFVCYYEVQFNIHGAMEGFNILLDRNGDCFTNEHRTMCSSGAWPVSIIYVLVIPITTIYNIHMIRKLIRLRKEK